MQGVQFVDWSPDAEKRRRVSELQNKLIHAIPEPPLPDDPPRAQREYNAKAWAFLRSITCGVGALTEEEMHFYKGHVGVSKADVLETLLTKDETKVRRANARFKSPDIAARAICEAIFYKSKEIAQTIVENPRSREDIKIQVPIMDDDENPIQIGEGYARFNSDGRQLATKSLATPQSIRPIQTNTVSVILARNPDNPYGIALVTATPTAFDDLADSELGKQTGDYSVRNMDRDESVINVLHQTPTFRKGSPLKKGYLDLICSKKSLERPVDMSYDNDDYTETVTIREKGRRSEAAMNVRYRSEFGLSRYARPKNYPPEMLPAVVRQQTQVLITQAEKYMTGWPDNDYQKTMTSMDMSL